MTFLFVVAMIIIFLAINYIVQKKKSPAVEKWPLLSIPLQSRVAGRSLARIQGPGNLPAAAFLHPGHTWLTIRENGNVRVGIDSFATEALGAGEELNLPPVETGIKAGEPMMGLHVAGREAKFVAPVDGEVIAVNDRASPDKLPNEWLVEIKPKRLGRQLQNLRAAEVAWEWLAREKTRFRDFLAALDGKPALALQDGGDPLPGIMANADNKTWEAFQQRFLSVKCETENVQRKT
jgi:glycine cleavage system H lipoate-binding protein